MSSRNQKNLLQLSIATLFLFQFFLMFSPSTATGFLTNVRFEGESKTRIRYDMKITTVDGRPLQDPIFVSQTWNNLGIEEYAKAQILIDDLGRALQQENFEKARGIYLQLTEEHLDKYEEIEFEVQKIRVVKAPVKSNAYNLNRFVDDSWSSEFLSESK